MAGESPAITFYRPNLVTVTYDTDTYRLSDHNRSPLSVKYDRIAQPRRTASGRRRKYHIADKREFTLSWTTLPGMDENTVDRHAGVDSLVTLFESAVGSATLEIVNRDGSTSQYTVHIDDFDYELKYRYVDDHYYDCSILMTEV